MSSNWYSRPFCKGQGMTLIVEEGIHVVTASQNPDNAKCERCGQVVWTKNDQKCKWKLSDSYHLS